MKEKLQQRTCKIILSVALLLIIVTAVIVKINWKSSPCVLPATPSPTAAAAMKIAAKEIKPDPLQIIAAISASSGSTLMQTAEDLYDDRKLVTVISVYGNGGNASIVQLVDSKNVIHVCAVPYANVRKPIRRLSRQLVLFLVDENQRDEQLEALRTKLVLLNTTTCEHRYVYDAAVPTNLMIMMTDESKDERFTVMMNGKEFCNGSDWCRLFFEPQFKKIEALDFNFDFSIEQLVSIEPARSFDAYLFAVRFTDDAGIHRVRLYNLSADRTRPLYNELFSLDGYQTKAATTGKLRRSYYKTQYEMVSSGLSYCWRSITDNELSNLTYCSRFGEDGKLMFNKTVDYPNILQHSQVKTISEGLILLSPHCNRTTNECGIMKIAVFTRKAWDFPYENYYRYQEKDHQFMTFYGSRSYYNPFTPLTKNVDVQYRQYNFECMGGNHIKTLTFTVRKKGCCSSYEVQYLCDNWLNYTYGVISMK